MSFLSRSKFLAKIFDPSQHVFNSKRIVAVAGSGSGKTTLVHNILHYMRFHEDISYEFYACCGTEEEDPCYSHIGYSSFVLPYFSDEWVWNIIMRQRKRRAKFKYAFELIKADLFKNYASPRLLRKMTLLSERADEARRRIASSGEAYLVDKLKFLVYRRKLKIYRAFVTEFLRRYDVAPDIKKILCKIYKDIDIIILIDDCQDKGGTVRKSESVSYLFAKCPHINITLFLCSQYAMSIGPDFRTCIDKLFLPIDTSNNQEKIYSQYLGGMFGNKKTFHQYYNTNTQGNNVFVIVNGIRSPHIEDRLFRYPVTEIEMLKWHNKRLGTTKQKMKHKKNIKRHLEK